MSPGLDRLRAALKAAGCRPRYEGRGLRAYCPNCQADGKAHDPALKADDHEGNVLFHCHGAGSCQGGKILERLRLDWSDVKTNEPGRPGPTRPREVKRWTYTDENDHPLFDVVRLEPGEGGKRKTFRHHMPGKKSGGIGNVRRVLFRLRGVIDAVRDGSTIYLVEGEKCADAVNDCPDVDRIFATTNPGGAKNWRDEYADPLIGAARVVVWRDRDRDGEHWSRCVAASLAKRRIPHQIVESAHAHDAADHLAAGHALDNVIVVEPERAQPNEAAIEPIAPADVFAATESVPRYRVHDLVLRGGLSFTWAVRAGFKSYLELALALCLLQPHPRGDLFGVPGLEILEGYRKVLWLACEESIGRLLYRARRLLRGMGLVEPGPDRLVYLPARADGFLLTLANLPQLAAQHGVDCVSVDYLTGFRAIKDDGGRRVEWDRDNDMAHEATRPLRELAARGVDVRIIHHANAEGSRGRGASEWFNACDTELCLGEGNDESQIKVEVKKQKDAPKRKPFLLAIDWSDDATRVSYGGEPGANDLTPQERAAVAYLEGVGCEGDPEKRTTGEVGETLTVSRARASEILNSARKKGRVGFHEAKKGRREWFVVSTRGANTSDDQNG